MNRYYRTNFFKSRKNLKTVILVVLFLVLVYVYIGGDSGLLQIWRQNRKKSILIKEIAEQEKIKEKKQEEKVKLLQKDTDYIEKKAREDLGMVKKGEEVYIITRDKKKQEEK